MKRIFLILAILVAIITVSCDDDIVPVKEFHDTATQIFLENGRMVDATTQFTQQQLETALLRTAWQRDYSFYYDKSKVGMPGEISYWTEAYYVFNSDGTAQLKAVDNSHTYDYRYTVQNHIITLVGADATFTLRAVALDQNRLVIDTPADSESLPRPYDAATATVRIIFRPRSL